MGHLGRIDAISGNNSRAKRTTKIQEYLNNFQNTLTSTTKKSTGLTGSSLFGDGFANSYGKVDANKFSGTTCASNANL